MATPTTVPLTPPTVPAPASQTTLSGIAKNAKLGAILERLDGSIIYVGGMRAWPDEAAKHDRLVAVTGCLAKRALPVVSQSVVDGSWSQGTGNHDEAEDDEIQAAQWELVTTELKKTDTHGESSRHTVTTSREPIKAPANYRSLAPRGEFEKEERGLCTEWTGSGYATTQRCEQCGNELGNLQIFCNEGSSYPNGNKWKDWEIECAGCGFYSYVTTFREG